MADAPAAPDLAKAKAAHPGAPKQALSGGGSETHAGSNEGGSAYGDDREDEDAAAPAKPIGEAGGRG